MHIITVNHSFSILFTAEIILTQTDSFFVINFGIIQPYASTAMLHLTARIYTCHTHSAYKTITIF